LQKSIFFIRKPIILLSKGFFNSMIKMIKIYGEINYEFRK
jgi:hypothetical protein